MRRLEGKVAIVTGGATGIGFGAGKVLASHGANVILVDYADNTEAAAEEICRMGFQAAAMRVDVSKAEETEQMAKAIMEQWGRIDILFNNAGVNRRAKFENVDPQVRDFIFGVNIYGVWNVTSAVYPYMMKQKYGRIINTASVTGIAVVDEGQTCYSVTKGAVMGFTKALAYEAASHKITVNAILPGWVRTPMVEKSAQNSRPEDPEGAMKEMAKFIPMGRLCQPEEIGDLVAFLASDEAAYITGTSVTIDGGSTLPETFDVLHA